MTWQHGGTTIGLAYRSRLFFNISGTAEFKNAPALFTSSGVFKNTGVHARLSLPDTLDLSASQDLGPAWRISGTARYIRWSTFHNLTITYDNPNQPASTQLYDYRNVWFLALGADYRLNESWTLHGGIAYDESPFVQSV